jgi:hypothetical protein
MSSRKILKHSFVVAALALVGPALAPAPAAADDVSDSAAQAVITTHGSGEVDVRPDSVRVDVGVEAQAATLEQARTQANAAMTRAIAALRSLNLPDLTISTRQLRFSPVYAPPKNDMPPSIIGYSASNHVTVTSQNASIDELPARAARIVDTAMNAGANNVGSIEFYLADPSTAEDEALARAVENARHDAEVMARAAGVTLGALASMEEATALRVPRMYALAASAPATPIEVGSITISSDVTARFSFR